MGAFPVSGRIPTSPINPLHTLCASISCCTSDFLRSASSIGASSFQDRSCQPFHHWPLHQSSVFHWLHSLCLQSASLRNSFYRISNTISVKGERPSISKDTRNQSLERCHKKALMEVTPCYMSLEHSPSHNRIPQNGTSWPSSSSSSSSCAFCCSKARCRHTSSQAGTQSPGTWVHLSHWHLVIYLSIYLTNPFSSQRNKKDFKLKT